MDYSVSPDQRDCISYLWPGQMESNSSSLAYTGAYLNAYGGMHFFHHKTYKPKFYIGVPSIFILEVIAAAAVIYFLYA